MIADEPTTALDVTVQAQVLGLLQQLLQQLSRELNMAVLLITHDLSVVAAICRWVAVMYRGQVVEWGTAEQIFCAPNHPYTQKLLREERP
jgi:ABC-type dipeptide/oligopeptide/nickel transport system ATPase component